MPNSGAGCGSAGQGGLACLWCDVTAGGARDWLLVGGWVGGWVGGGAGPPPAARGGYPATPPPQSGTSALLGLVVFLCLRSLLDRRPLLAGCLRRPLPYSRHPCVHMTSRPHGRMGRRLSGASRMPGWPSLACNRIPPISLSPTPPIPQTPPSRSNSSHTHSLSLSLSQAYAHHTCDLRVHTSSVERALAMTRHVAALALCLLAMAASASATASCTAGEPLALCPPAPAFACSRRRCCCPPLLCPAAPPTHPPTHPPPRLLPCLQATSSWTWWTPPA